MVSEVTGKLLYLWSRGNNMIELPESYTISSQIEKNFAGKIISYIEVLHTPHSFEFFLGDI